ncbi:hypothetical protein GN330_12000 [Nitratireductor sp. CAU 1489]|uniref:Uncharacterized protein n=1 Tax=Nitratireductor arenosus TaxID=2682096 RepID=A0A844QFV5_9HYPH|nr:hypothetical protein [Nitratireductor arenosus]MVA97967.1 hypothetical protein [Nitratireductor arenosus]
MMVVSPPIDLRRSFRQSSGEAYRLAARQHQLAEKERRERKEQMEGEAAEFMDFAMAMITIDEANEFRIELDTYDAATIAALQENERQLIHTREEMDRLLAKAHVLPDGRRVFKTDDGLRVFDEHGEELFGDVIAPGEIDDRRPRWEKFETQWQRLESLEHERTDILDYQQKLDDARERLDEGNLTRGEYEQLREGLKADMPGAVRAQIPDLARDHDAEAAPDSVTADIDLDISEDMMPSTAPTGPTPG